jgi:hypothetical protein
MISIVPVSLNAGSVSGPTLPDSTNSGQSTLISSLTYRLEEIKAMDKSKLSSTERKELKNEVRTIKKQLKAVGGGVYLSAGAIIIIILLLILIL